MWNCSFTLRRIFGPKRYEITDRREPHSVELHDLLSSPIIIRVTNQEN